MKLLLLGKDGQVGSALARQLGALGELQALGREDGGDLVHLAALAATVRHLRPDVIVNAAAYTDVDKAEADTEAAFLVNAEAPAMLAHVAAECGAWLVHFSTDYVFDGSGTRAWAEQDAPSPLNAYGRSKLEGERRIAAALSRHLIFRTSWVYSTRGENFANTMLRLAAQRERLTVVADQVGAPTSAQLLADMTVQALRHALGEGGAGVAGLYHLAAAGETTWHGYASFLIGEAREAGLPVAVHNDGIEPVSSMAFPSIARRPLNSRLDTSAFRRVFGVGLPRWEEGVRELVREITARKKV